VDEGGNKPTSGEGGQATEPSATTRAPFTYMFFSAGYKPGTWGDAAREIFKTGLSLRYVDSHGLTERFTLAWLSPRARAMRKRSPAAQGPWGAFVSLSTTHAGRWAHFRFEMYLNLCVGSLFAVLFTFPALWSPIFLAVAVASGLAAIELLPQLEGLDTDVFVDLEATTREDLEQDLLGWLEEESAAAKPNEVGGRCCPTCDRLNRAEAEGRLGPRWLDDESGLGDAQGQKDSGGAGHADAGSVDGFQSPLTYHPEAPTLGRREALERLAWALTLLAKEVGMTAADAHSSPVRARPANINRWVEFKQEMREEAWKALQYEVSYGGHGHTEILISLPFLLPEAIRFRRRFAENRCYGPLGAMWWPYRYSGGFRRDAALELAVLGILAGGAIAVWGALSLSPLSALWWRSVCGGLVILLCGLLGSFALAGSVENWGDSIDLPIIDLFRNSIPDPHPIVYPRAPGPLQG
jgi:hypothetical protein